MTIEKSTNITSIKDVLSLEQNRNEKQSSLSETSDKNQKPSKKKQNSAQCYLSYEASRSGKC